MKREIHACSKLKNAQKLKTVPRKITQYKNNLEQKKTNAGSKTEENRKLAVTHEVVQPGEIEALTAAPVATAIKQLK